MNHDSGSAFRLIRQTSGTNAWLVIVVDAAACQAFPPSEVYDMIAKEPFDESIVHEYVHLRTNTSFLLAIDAGKALWSGYLREEHWKC